MFNQISKVVVSLFVIPEPGEGEKTLIVAVLGGVSCAVTNQAPDQQHLSAIMERSKQVSGQSPAELLADTGYWERSIAIKAVFADLDPGARAGPGVPDGIAGSGGLCPIGS